MTPIDPEFPCSLTLMVPFPTDRLASYARQALQVDAELSPLVRRSFSLRAYEASSDHLLNGAPDKLLESDAGDDRYRILCTEYKATTNRMLRVAVNGFMESLSLILQIMEELDVDILSAELKSSTT
ncbi:MAG: hypothetical protein Q9190_000576 [Brigantiaea leucoxantha]